MSTELLIDNSAFSHLRRPALDPVRAKEVLDLMNARAIAVCLPFLLEAGYSARDFRDHVNRLDGLLALPRYVIDHRVEDRALEAQRELAVQGHHRVSPTDLLLASLADRNRLGVLHYDHHYDLLLERTTLRFQSVWLAPQGSL